MLSLVDHPYQSVCFELLADALVAVSQLARRPDIAEREVNPLIVRREGEGVVAVDAVAWCRDNL